MALLVIPHQETIDYDFPGCYELVEDLDEGDYVYFGDQGIPDNIKLFEKIVGIYREEGKVFIFTDNASWWSDQNGHEGLHVLKDTDSVARATCGYQIKTASSPIFAPILRSKNDPYSHFVFHAGRTIPVVYHQDHGWLDEEMSAEVYYWQ